VGVRTRLILGSANPRLNLTATVSLRGRDQNHHAEACDLPTPAYGWFIEDLDTPDLRRQKPPLKTLHGYRYYVSAALIAEAGTDRAQGWRLPAQEIEDAVIRVLTDALTSPARLLERFAAAIPSDQTRKMLDRATRLAAALNRSPAQRAKVVRDLIEKVIVEENTITIRVRRSSLEGGPVVPPSSENPSDSPIELTAPVAFQRRGGEMRLVLPEVAIQSDRSRCDPTLIKAIARGRAWFEELAAGRARSLRELAERDGVTRRYVRRLVDLAFLSPDLVEVILQGRQPVALTATRLTELDLPLDWADQRSLLTN
jgi:site-specific DNA recombinase